MNLLFFVLILNCGRLAYGISSKIEENVTNYFNNEKVLLFEEKWEVYRKSVENAIESALKETFGKPGMNVYVKSVDDTHKVTEGFLHTDRVIFILFKNLNLSRYPYLRNPRVWFPLASNVLRVEATVSKMLIHSEYVLFRNHYDVVYPANKEEERNSSPFSRQQVQSRGLATLIAEHCVLHGDTVATLHGLNVNLGYNNFQLDNCKFSVEISTPGLGAPPVIEPYFSTDKASALSQCLMMTLLDELMPKLQAAVHSCVNTTAVLGSSLPMIRQYQREIFRLTTDYSMNVMRSMNKLSTVRNVASQVWKDYKISWGDKKIGNKVVTNEVTLKDMTLSGLDSAYTGRTGGPVKTDAIKIYEDLRIHGVQLHGIAHFRVDGIENKFQFSSEIQDVMCKTKIDISDMKAENSTRTEMTLPKEVELQVTGWRNLQIFGPPNPVIDTYAFITGLLLNRVPATIVKHFSRTLKGAIRHTESPNKQSLAISESKESNEQTVNEESMKQPFNKPHSEDSESSDKIISDAKPANEYPSGDEESETEDVADKSDDIKMHKSERGKENIIKEKMFKTYFFGEDDAVASGSDKIDPGEYPEQTNHKSESSSDDASFRRRKAKLGNVLPKQAHMSDNEIRSE